MQEIMAACKKCGNKLPYSQLKLDLDLKMVVCPDCIKNKGIHKEIEQEALHKEQKEELMIKSAEGQSHTQAEEPKPSKIGHKCTSCGYKFKIDIETKIPKYCPYCNARVMGF